MIQNDRNIILKFIKDFKKDIKDLPKELVETVRKATDEIVINPYLFNKLSGSFSEYFKYKLKANRVEYRIIFTTENNTVENSIKSDSSSTQVSETKTVLAEDTTSLALISNSISFLFLDNPKHGLHSFTISSFSN